MEFEIFTTYSSFKRKLFQLYPKDSVPTASVSKSKVNHQILKQYKDETEVLKIIHILLTICRQKLNTDYLLASFSNKNNKYSILLKDKKIQSFISYSEITKSQFQKKIDMSEFQQFVLEENVRIPRFMANPNYSIIVVHLLCSCQKGKGKEIIQLLQKNYHNSVFIVSNPMEELQSYYKSLGFHYDILVQWSGNIWK